MRGAEFSKPCFVDYDIAEQQNIDIDGTRTLILQAERRPILCSIANTL